MLHLLGVVSHDPLGPLNFKDSPFYRIIKQLTPTVECKGEAPPGTAALMLLVSSNRLKQHVNTRGTA